MDAVDELRIKLDAMDLSPQIAFAAVASVSQSLLGDYTGAEEVRKSSEVASHG